MSKRTLQGFPPEYFDIWNLAVEGKLSLQFPTKGKATNKKVDLYRFRKRLSEETGDLAAAYFQVDLRVTDEGVLQSYVPDWKLAVRAQIAASDLSTEAIAEIAAETLEEKQQEIKDSMGGVLDELGFKPEAGK